MGIRRLRSEVKKSHDSGPSRRRAGKKTVVNWLNYPGFEKVFSMSVGRRRLARLPAKWRSGELAFFPRRKLFCRKVFKQTKVFATYEKKWRTGSRAKAS